MTRNSLKKTLTICLVLFIAISHALSQDSIFSKIETWTNDTYYNEFLYIDLSQAFIYENCSYIGVFGKNFQKINIRFNNVNKKSDISYLVRGVSMLKSNKCHFSGEVIIKRLELVHFDIDNSEIWLAAVGNFEFEEQNKDGGIFTGYFRKYFIYSISSKDVAPADSHIELDYDEGYAGIWYKKNSKTVYPCHFGFNRYPPKLAKGFDNMGGESNINKKYKSYGWSSHFSSENPNIGYYSNIECNNSWWLEE